jgi:hypothetical protein
VQVEDDRVGIQLLGELYRFQPVRCRAHDGQLGLPVDQLTEGIAKVAIIVRDQDADPPVGGFPERFRHQLKASLAPVGMQPNAGVAIIGAALDLGAGRRGVDMGPSAIRYAGLYARIESLGRRVEDWGNVTTAVAEASSVGDERTRFLPQIKRRRSVSRDPTSTARRSASLRSSPRGWHWSGSARSTRPSGSSWRSSMRRSTL